MLTTSRGCREIPSPLCLRNLKRDLLNRPHPSRKFNLGPRARLKLSILGPSAARARADPCRVLGSEGSVQKVLLKISWTMACQIQLEPTSQTVETFVGSTVVLILVVFIAFRILPPERSRALTGSFNCPGQRVWPRV